MKSITAIAAVVLLLGSPAFSQQVTFEEADIALLKEIDKLEKNAKVVSGLLVFSGLTNILTNDKAELVYNVTQLDLPGLANGMKNFQKITACTINEKILAHLSDSVAANEYWEKARKPYEDFCTKA